MHCVSESEWNQIYDSDKKKHFHKIQQESGIAFSDMLFFDNQMDNVESVMELGVHCVYTPRGLTWQHWNDGLSLYHAHKTKHTKDREIQ